MGLEDQCVPMDLEPVLTAELVRSCPPKMMKAEDTSVLTGAWLELPGLRSFFRSALLLRHSSHC